MADREQQNDPQPPKKRGRPPFRPNPKDPGILDRLCEGIISGDSITKVCKPLDMPDYTMVYRVMASDPEFAKAIAQARVAQQEAEIDKMIDIADAATEKTAQVAKLQIWARQWRAAKLAPKKYGDRIQTEVTGADGGPIKVETKKLNLQDMSDDELEILESILKKAVEK
jgi:hypothetical protein